MQNVFNTYLRGKTFPLFKPPFQRIFETNDTSFESPYIGLLESAKKFGDQLVSLSQYPEQRFNKSSTSVDWTFAG